MALLLPNGYDSVCIDLSWSYSDTLVGGWCAYVVDDARAFQYTDGAAFLPVLVLNQYFGWRKVSL